MWLLLLACVLPESTEDTGQPCEPLTWHADGDADGFGELSSSQLSCTQPPGFVADATDCDDGAAAAFPGAPETCDGLDNNCDGTIDESSAIDAGIWYADGDGDGFGDVGSSVLSCAQPPGFVADATDCNDGAAATFPGAPETCDGLDNNCDGFIDESSAIDAGIWYADGDGDGFGDAGSFLHSCTRPPGFVADATDCNDGAATAYPGAVETCDRLDNNCDGFTDESSAIDAGIWYADGDGDGFGDVLSSQRSCTQPPGFVADSTDCDDGAAATFPGALETCDRLDNNCDGFTDESSAIDAGIWYADGDGDGFGDAASFLHSCARPRGFVADTTDCNDSAAGAHPGAPEACDRLDNNCDGFTDESSAIDAGIWYADGDGDGFGDVLSSQRSCTQPPGFVADVPDCDDGAAATFPGAPETCDGLDNNCDGFIDESTAVDAGSWYADRDGDGFGGVSSLRRSCTQPPGFVADPTDCNDGDSAVSPTAPETCDGLDNNCDGFTDESSAIDAGSWYADGDGDGFGDAGVSQRSCTQPPGFVADATDCDDGAAATFPGAPETCDGLDNNCDGFIDESTAVDAGSWYADRDGDGFGGASSLRRSCTQPPGFVADPTDCNDGDSAVSPTAPETCDGLDNNCDGFTDESSAIDAGSWYADGDGDGFGDAGVSQRSCTQPPGFVADATDCNDGDSAVSPTAPETCDGLDNNCDGQIDDLSWYADVDGDGYGNASSSQISCTQPPGFVADATDCNDSDPGMYPFAWDASADGVDQNCDGLDGFADDVVCGSFTTLAEAFALFSAGPSLLDTSPVESRVETCTLTDTDVTWESDYLWIGDGYFLSDRSPYYRIRTSVGTSSVSCTQAGDGIYATGVGEIFDLWGESYGWYAAGDYSWGDSSTSLSFYAEVPQGGGLDPYLLRYSRSENEAYEYYDNIYDNGSVESVVEVEALLQSGASRSYRYEESSGYHVVLDGTLWDNYDHWSYESESCNLNFTSQDANNYVGYTYYASGSDGEHEILVQTSPDLVVCGHNFQALTGRYYRMVGWATLDGVGTVVQVRNWAPYPGDSDGDGWPADFGDCDDQDPSTNPCGTDDGLDRNCDGLVQ